MPSQPKIDRREVMRLAHREWRLCRMRGWDAPGDDQWTFARCLRLSWAIHKQRRVFTEQHMALAA